MNEPFACTENSFNNSSVAYRVEMGGKRILFLGDMGWQAGEDFLANHTQEELKSDVLQMAPPWAERRRRGALPRDFTGGLLMADAGLALG